jgi:hypothetical protein
MQNPWLNYDYQSNSTIHSLDTEAVNAFNARIASSRAIGREEFLISSTHTALPFFGSTDAKLLILAANPGLKIGETEIEETHERRQLFNLARRHELEGNPFVFLRPEFEGTPGYTWWSSRTRQIRELVGDDVFTSSTFSAEIHPYKSVKYRSLNSAVPTQLYTATLVDSMVEAGSLVIVLRARKEWNELVPSLVANPNVIELNSAQNSYMSSGNMAPGQFERLIAKLTIR